MTIIITAVGGVGIIAATYVVSNPDTNAVMAFMGDAGKTFDFSQSFLEFIAKLLTWLAGMISFSPSMVLGLLAIIFTIFSTEYGNGLITLVADFISVVHVIYAVFGENKERFNKILEDMFPFAGLVNKMVTYGSALVVSSSIANHLATGEYTKG